MRHTFASSGTSVTLTVTDDGSLSDSDATSVTVSDGSVTLSASGYKVKGVQLADLEWSGAAGANVDVHRGGALVTTTANNGFLTDTIGRKGGGSYACKVCEAGSSTCSNEAVVTLRE